MHILLSQFHKFNCQVIRIIILEYDLSWYLISGQSICDQYRFATIRLCRLSKMTYHKENNLHAIVAENSVHGFLDIVKIWTGFRLFIPTRFHQFPKLLHF